MAELGIKPTTGLRSNSKYGSLQPTPFNMGTKEPQALLKTKGVENPYLTYEQSGANVASVGQNNTTTPTPGMSMETAAAFAPKTGVGSAIGGAIGMGVGGPLGAMVGGGIGAVADILINWLSESYAQDEYKKVADENRKYAEKIYREQVARENEQEQYKRGIYTKERAYTLKQDKKAEEWAIKQDKYNKYLTQVSAFSNFLNSDGAVRQNLINNWQNMSRLQAA